MSLLHAEPGGLRIENHEGQVDESPGAVDGGALTRDGIEIGEVIEQRARRSGLAGS
jgi:hypothetical protein